MPTSIEKKFIAMAKAVHSGKLTPGQIDQEVTSFVANSLLKGVFTGFNGDFDTVDYASPDRKMLSYLEKNVFHFSAVKNYHEVVELNNALRDGDRVLTFNEFKQKAFAINDKYNANYLRAEYNHAVASSQMARRWVDIQEAKDTHGCLRYDTAKDDRVRQTHRGLEGVTKPIDDAFWDTWYPPNGWNCRCDVQQVPCSKVTEDSKIVLPNDVPDMFKTNTAKLGMIYPPKHPYWAMPGAMQKKVFQQFDSFYNANTEAYYKLTGFPNKSSLEVHGLAYDSDLKHNITNATWWCERVKSLDLKIRPHFEGKLYQGYKNPELLVDNTHLADFKDAVDVCTHSSLQSHILGGMKQKCTNLFINISHPDATPQLVIDAIRGVALNRKNVAKSHIETYFLRYNENWIRYTREEALENNITKLKNLFNQE